MKTKFFTFCLVAISLLYANKHTAQTSQCPTDLNNDGITNSSDYALFTPHYNTSCPGGGSPCPTDFNNDGVTNINDYTIFSAAYGKRCHVMIFGISTATISGGYADIPVSISSDANISGMDFAMQFNLSKLTFHSILSYPHPSNSDLAYFNPSDFFLRYTATVMGVYYPNDVTVFTIRFTTSSGSITTGDFSAISAILNGNSCGYILK